MKTPAPAQRRRIADKPTIAVHYSRLVAREIGARGPRLALLLRGTGIEPAAFMHQDILLSTAQQTTLATNALRLSGDDGLGLRIGRLLAPEVYGPLGFLVRSSPDVQTAIEDFRTFLPTRIPFVVLHCERDARWLRCRLEVRERFEPRFHRATIETIALSLLSIVESIAGPIAGEGTMHCAYPAPAYAARYARFFPVPVRFDEPLTALRLSAHIADTLNPIASRADHALAMKMCQSMAERLADQSDSVANRVRQALLSGPPGTVREQDVAAALFMSRRTLSRRLAGESTRFRLIQAAILAELAATQLRDTRHTIESISALLNYHDAANFRRAFKAWFACTPEDFRRRHSRDHS